MASSKHTNTVAKKDTSRGREAAEALLRSEIEFWRELIDSCPDNHPEESIERMNQALALAESRLSSLPGSSRPVSNVYHLDESRRESR